MSSHVQLSVVIPLYNEEESIPALTRALETSLRGLAYEILFVDDGSTDKTVQKVRAALQPGWRLLVFRRNFGQTSAIAAGIVAANGRYIVTMDGDLQNDPADIPMMLETLQAQDADVVVGWRKNRYDDLFLRKVPSKLANILIRKMTGVNVHDYGCTLKLFTSETAKDLDLYGELHRFVPVLARLTGAKIVEVEVTHHTRRYGQSKYGIGRTLRVLSDLFLMYFFLEYRQKPMHLFGTISLVSFMLGGLILGYLAILKFMGESIGTRPLFFLGLLLIITAVQFITAGFISEQLMRTYFESSNKPPYSVREIFEGEADVESKV